MTERERLAREVERLHSETCTHEAAQGPKIYCWFCVADLILREKAAAASAAISEEHERMRGVLEEQKAAVVEWCAQQCEQARPAGGRAWTEGQAACFEALSHVADYIRSANPAAAKVLSEVERKARLEELTKLNEHLKHNNWADIGSMCCERYMAERIAELERGKEGWMDKSAEERLNCGHPISCNEMDAERKGCGSNRRASR